MACLADELACVIAMGKPSLLLPAIKTRCALAQLGDQRLIEFFFSIQSNAVFINEGCAEPSVSAPIGNAPGTDACFVIFDGVYRPHIDVATSLVAADAGSDCELWLWFDILLSTSIPHPCECFSRQGLEFAGLLKGGVFSLKTCQVVFGTKGRFQASRIGV